MQQTNDYIERQLDIHLVRIVNMCRGGITDNDIRLTADFCQVPQWLVMRIAHDLGALTPEQETLYQQSLLRLERVSKTPEQVYYNDRDNDA